MKIDFHTHYSKEHFEALCKKAKSLGLDGLVMEGIPYQESFSANGLTIFPAQEVLWTAPLEIYNQFLTEDRDIESKVFKTEIFKGKALVLMPENKLTPQEKSLDFLILRVSEERGVIISLHDEKNIFVPSSITDKKLNYPFHATRIRPFNGYDIGLLMPIIRTEGIAVAGSNATTSDELTYGKGFTEFELRIKTKEQLIQSIRNKSPTKLYVHGEPNIRIEDTAGPKKVVFDPNLLKGFS